MQIRVARVAGRGKNADLAGAVLRQQGVQRVDALRQDAADQFRYQGRGPAIADHFRILLDLAAQHQREEVRQAAGGRHADRELLGVGAQPLAQGGHVLDGRAGRHGQRELVAADQRHRREVALGVIAGLGIDQRRHDHDRGVGQHQHVLPRRGRMQRLGRDASARPGFVFDHHGHPHAVLQAIGNQPRDAVGTAARGVADHQRQGAVQRRLLRTGQRSPSHHGRGHDGFCYPPLGPLMHRLLLGTAAHCRLWFFLPGQIQISRINLATRPLLDLIQDFQ
ncbi:hypothetical protein D3C72_1321950 [compost metagenome]